jgi:hypothetical protein
VPPAGGKKRWEDKEKKYLQAEVLICNVIHRDRVVLEDLAKVPCVHTLLPSHWPRERVRGPSTVARASQTASC